MSVFNRKMFKPRNARNALNMSAGVMPVQKFNAGGLAALKRFNHGGSVHIGTRPRTMGTTSSMSGLPGVYTAPNYSGVAAVGKPIAEIAQRYISGQPISEREFSLLRGAETSFLAGNTVENLGKGTRIGEGIASVLKPVAQGIGGATGYTKGALSTASKYLFGDPSGQTPPTPEVNLQPIGGLRDLTLGKDGKPINPDGESPEDYNKRVNAAMAAARPSASGTFGQRVNSATPPQLNIDYLKSIGIDFLDPTNLQTASSRGGPVPPSAFGKAVPPNTQIKNPFEDQRATTQRIEDERIARAEMDRIGSVVGNEEAGLSPTGFLPTTTPSLESATDNALTTSDSSPEPVDQMFMGLGDAPPPKGDGTSTSTTKGGAEGTDGSDGAPTGKEEIDRVINSGTKEEKQSTLDGFIKEFMDKAPGYEGADSGLILAKIGFAMAAGKSPRAIENIASAMSDGADMLIKDKAKKDEFNRQLKLSALQYGLTEDSKLRTQQRADERTFRNLVATSAGSYTNAAGEKVNFQEGQTLSIPMTDIMANGGQLPAELRNQSFHLEMVKAAADKQKGINAILAAQRKEQVLTDKSQREESEIFGKATDRYIAGEIGTKYIESALVNLTENGDDILGLQGGAKDLGQKLANQLGLKAPKNYANKQAFEKDVKKGFQLLIKSYFGGSQSANSISNFDVTSLSDAVVDSAITQKDGSFNLSSLNEDILQDQLQGLLQQFRRDQQSALSTMAGVETRLSTRALPGQVVGSADSLLQPNQARLQQYISGSALPGGQAARYARQEPKDGDGGMPRFALGAS